jgi:hypothetical protein
MPIAASAAQGNESDDGFLMENDDYDDVVMEPEMEEKAQGFGAAGRREVRVDPATWVLSSPSSSVDGAAFSSDDIVGTLAKILDFNGRLKAAKKKKRKRQQRAGRGAVKSNFSKRRKEYDMSNRASDASRNKATLAKVARAAKYWCQLESCCAVGCCAAELVKSESIEYLDVLENLNMSSTMTMTARKRQVHKMAVEYVTHKKLFLKGKKACQRCYASYHVFSKSTSPKL